jgi:arylsulfatase
MFKRYSQFSGGTCDPLVIHWPKGIKAKGEVRDQYHHSTDIVPTILEVVGLEMPAVYRGVEQFPLNGVSMKYSFDDAKAKTKKEVQYYTMLGTRGIWKDGWKASALHAPISGAGHFDKDVWELYHVDVDRSESKDLAKENPDKLKELIDVWFDEAKKNNVLPLDDRSAVELLTIQHPTSEPPRTRYIYYPFTSPIPEAVAVSIRGRSYKIVADVNITSDAHGVIFAHGSRFGGHALFIKDRRLYYVYNFLGIKPEQKLVSKEELQPGKHVLGMAFAREKSGQFGEAVGKAQLYIDDKVVAEGPLKTQAGHFTLGGDGLCVGYDSDDKVTEEYEAPNRFTDGTILGVGVDVGDDVYLDLEKEAAGALARD